MNMNTSTLVVIKNGVGELRFPQALKETFLLQLLIVKVSFLTPMNPQPTKDYS